MPVLTAKQNIERAKGAEQERREIVREIKAYLKDWRSDDGRGCSACVALGDLLRFVRQRAKDQ